MKPDQDTPSELADRVDQALEALWHGQTDGFDTLMDSQDSPGPGIGEIFDSATNASDLQAIPLPNRIGPYDILREIGRGGMGVVYEARQKEPDRLVAIKVIRTDRNISPERIQLFQREVQSLARLKHPSIAAIYEAGRTDQGLHWFAMELVEGTPLMDYVDQPPGGAVLKIADRMRLLAGICDAVSHAHQRGVIHRDLKPSNILVPGPGQESDSANRSTRHVKILDFGLARIADCESAATLTADSTRIRGTLAYMSPEQAWGDTAAIDMRTDIYSLGVVGYQMMTGRLPIDLRHRPIPEAVRAICDEKPPRLSTVNQKLRGDIETIIGKALEKDPDRRYQSASQLEDDILRFLNNQPITARPPSVIYQLRKLFARHKIACSALMVTFLIATTGFIVSTRLYLQARSARIAETRHRQIAQEISDFLTSMLASVNPRVAQGKDTALLRELLNDAARRVQTQFANSPEVRAVVENVIGQSYHAIGEYELAEKFLTSAHDIARARFGPDNKQTLSSAHNLATLWCDLGKLDQAIDLMTETLAIQRRVLGNGHPDTMMAINNLGDFERNRNHLRKAETLLTEAVALRRKVLGDDDPDTLVSMNNLANIYTLENNLGKAETLTRDLLEAQQRVLPPDSPDVLVSLNDLAVILRKKNDLDGALELQAQALAGFQRTLGPAHMDTLITHYNYVALLKRKGKAQQALDALNGIIKTARDHLAPDHFLIGTFVAMRARIALEQGRLEPAEADAVESLHQLRKTLDADHPSVRQATDLLARIRTAQKETSTGSGAPDTTPSSPQLAP